MAVAAAPKIKLYTNKFCPWAHRAHIALDELKVDYETEIIDLNSPRSPEYLKVNPRGLIPSLSYNGDIITESAIVATFLSDAFPSTLAPASTDPNGPLTRARIAFFVDAYFNKVTPPFMKAHFSKSEEERAKAIPEFVKAAATELDPLLADAAPFFGGSSKLTLAEVLTGPFVLRCYLAPNHGFLPKSLLADLAAKAPNFDKWAKEVMKHPSVISNWDEEQVVEHTKRRMG